MEANTALGIILGVVAVEFAMAGYLIAHKLPLQKPFAAASSLLLVMMVTGSLLNLLSSVTQAYSSATTGEKVFCVAVATAGLANLVILVRMSRAKEAIKLDSAPPSGFRV